MKFKSSQALYILFLFATILFAISACSDEYVPAPGKGDFFDVSENGCLGDCPNFKMRIHGDGAFTFQRYPDFDSAPSTGKLDPEESAKLFKKIKAFGLEEKLDVSQVICKTIAFGRSQIKMSLSIHGKIHEVTHDLGCIGFDGEEEFRKFEKEIYSILSIDKKAILPKMDLKTLSRNDYFEVSENGCMSGCPFFNMRIMGDGAFNFQQHKSYYSDYPPIGGKLTPENTKKLFQAIAGFGFEEYSSSRLRCVSIDSDNTTEGMTLFISGKTFEVSHNHGCTDFKRKSELLRFESELHSTLSVDTLLVNHTLAVRLTPQRIARGLHVDLRAESDKVYIARQ